MKEWYRGGVQTGVVLGVIALVAGIVTTDLRTILIGVAIIVGCGIMLAVGS